MKKTDLYVEQLMQIDENIHLFLVDANVAAPRPKLSHEMQVRMGPMAEVLSQQMKSIAPNPKHVIILTKAEYASMPLKIGDRLVLSLEEAEK